MEKSLSRNFYERHQITFYSTIFFSIDINLLFECQCCKNLDELGVSTWLQVCETSRRFLKSPCRHCHRPRKEKFGQARENISLMPKVIRDRHFDLRRTLTTHCFCQRWSCWFSKIGVSYHGNHSETMRKELRNLSPAGKRVLRKSLSTLDNFFERRVFSRKETDKSWWTIASFLNFELPWSFERWRCKYSRSWPAECTSICVGMRRPIASWNLVCYLFLETSLWNWMLTWISFRGGMTTLQCFF